MKEGGIREVHQQQILSTNTAVTDSTPPMMNPPETTSNETIIKMFNQLMDKMDTIQVNLSKDIKAVQDSSTTQIKQLEKVQTEHRLAVDEVKEEVCTYKNKIHKMVEVMEFQSHLIQELTEKVDRLEYDKMRPNLYIKGITEKENENTINVVQEFLKQKLKIDGTINIKASRRVGKSKHKPILVTLANPRDKGRIYSNVHNLQGIKNELNRAYQIEDQLPSKMQAMKNKIQHTRWRNRQKSQHSPQTRNVSQER